MMKEEEGERREGKVNWQIKLKRRKEERKRKEEKENREPCWE